MSQPVAQDVINLEGIRIMAYCGDLPGEQERRQPFDINLKLSVDTRPAAASDDLSKTVDYSWVVEEINAYFGKHKIRLIERMAQIVADIALKDELVEEVEVTVKKLHPPVSQQIGFAGICIRRSRN